MPLPYRRLVVKIGSNVLTQPNGLPDLDRLTELVAQVAALHAQGLEVIVVSSGAVAAGRSLLTLPPKTDAVRSRQVLAALGQVKLLGLYAERLAAHGLLGAQVLVTKEDFRDRQHYQNMQNCFLELLQQQVVPIVNENDVVAVTELMFTDNDELAGLIAAQLNADALIILSNVDGIFDGDPSAPGSQVIREIAPGATGFADFVTTQRSQFGRGGMLTKCHMAHKVAKLGISVHIANGRTAGILPAVLAETAVNTWFRPGKTASGKKKWLAHAQAAAQAVVRVNAGARAALTAAGHASSLLPVGVVAIEGTFQKGDIVRITDEATGQPFALGIAEYGADRALEWLGQQHQRALVHYDYLFLNADA
jgi:glutamate 5-kinase